MNLSNATKTSNSRKNSKYATILTRPIAFYRVYATIAGSACAGLFLSQAMYWDSKTDDPEGWFYKTYEQWTLETAINRYELDKIRHHLTNLNILETQLKGSPARLYYRINHKVLNNLLDAIKKGSFTSIRPKNKNTKKYSQISEFADGQQTDSVCLPSANLSADGQQTSSMTLNNPSCSRSTNSIYIESTEITTKITSEITHNAPPPNNVLPKSESMCETRQTDLTKQPGQEEYGQQQPASLSKKSESSPQTDIPSRGHNTAAQSFDKVEQANQIPDCPYNTAQNVEELIDAWITDPTAFASDVVPLVVREKIKWNRWVLPWHSGQRKLNNLYQNFNPIVVDFLAQELATKSKRSAQQEMVKKTLSRLAAPHIPADLLFKRNALQESHWNPLAQSCAEAMGLPFWLNDDPIITTSQMKSYLQDVVSTGGEVSLVIVDYVQLIEPMRRERGENRVQEIDSILKQLRAIAKQFNCAVLGLAQLKREVDSRAVHSNVYRFTSQTKIA